MKVLFSDVTFSYLFPGGKQVHAEKLFIHLKKIGVDVAYENWYDPGLTGDVVHFFGFNDFNKIKTLKDRGYKIIYTHILDGLTNQSSSKLVYHYYKNKIVEILPNKFNPIFPWKALKYFDAIVYMHENDRRTGIKMYGLDPQKTYVIPHAVDSLQKFKGASKNSNQKYLVSLGSIVLRKNAAFLAKVCKNNKIPIKFIGHAMDKNSDYFKEFISYTDNTLVQYLGFISEEEKINVLKSASGFVLLSLGESGCISVYEAGASGLPLLLSDLPWAKEYENPNNISFCSPTNYQKAERIVVNFYKNSKRQNHPTFTVHKWEEIAELYKKIYIKVLST